jgi:hypothetical protein
MDRLVCRVDRDFTLCPREASVLRCCATAALDLLGHVRSLLFAGIYTTKSAYLGSAGGVGYAYAYSILQDCNQALFVCFIRPTLIRCDLNGTFYYINKIRMNT